MEIDQNSKSTAKVDYSIVIPCYRSHETIGTVVSLLQKEFEDKSIQIVLVDDCSPDEGKTANAIRELVKRNNNVLGIWLSQNSGQHNATMCGLRHTVGEYVICMDDDMQTHPSEIKKMINRIKEGYDVVYACYPQKRESWFRRLGSAFSSWTVRLLIRKPKNLKTSSFWIARRFVIDSITEYSFPYTFLPGLVLRTTNRIGNVEVNHYERVVGTSGYSFKKLVKLWANIIGFSIKPLRMATVMGVSFSMIGIISALVVLIRKLFFSIRTVGWSSLIIAICFFSGVLLLFMGIIGEYIGRMFMAATCNPQYVIRDKEGLK